MKKVLASFLPGFESKNVESWALVQPQTIDVLNWEAFPYLPQVHYKVVHNGSMLFIQFDVAEREETRTQCRQDHDPVYQDSCVEFFIQTRDNSYHNFEFNSAGVMLSASGKERSNRTSRSGEELTLIERISSGVHLKGGLYCWSLVVGIPFAILGLVRGGSYKANFYKCGDLTPVKHYVSWSPIDTLHPNFHSPQFFGELVLA